MIVGFPGEDEAAFRNTLEVVRAAPIRRQSSILTATRHGDRRSRHRPPAVKKERSARLRAVSHAACLARWRAKLDRDDLVLVDRPGRGYGDDYSPWLVDAGAPIGEPVRVRGAEVTDDGILAA